MLLPRVRLTLGKTATGAEVTVPLTEKEVWLVIHGMGLGATFLLAYAGGLAGLWSFRPEFRCMIRVSNRRRGISVGKSQRNSAGGRTVPDRKGPLRLASGGGRLGTGLSWPNS